MRSLSHTYGNESFTQSKTRKRRGKAEKAVLLSHSLGRRAIETKSASFKKTKSASTSRVFILTIIGRACEEASGT